MLDEPEADLERSRRLPVIADRQAERDAKREEYEKLQTEYLTQAVRWFYAAAVNDDRVGQYSSMFHWC